MRRPALALALVGLALPATALASWQASGGNGNSYSRANSLAGGATPTTSISGQSVTVNWAAAGGPVPVNGYVVKRYANGGGAQTIGATCAGVVSGLSCTESNVPAGSWRYTVTPARDNWRGAESAQSAAVTIASPSLSLSPSTPSCLPESLNGQIQNFIAGQTVSFRLDNPTSGQMLTGSITPSPVPAGGTANASVTIPGGISDGAHTVYAVGSGGDIASAPVTVNTAGMRVATGGYSGNGSDNRNITAVGFQPDVVIIKASNSGAIPSRVAVIRTSTMPADSTKQLAEAAADFSNGIQSLSADGFQIGSDGRVNASGSTYYWTALKARSGHMAVGSYAGNGTSGHAITGLGFSPEYAMVIPADITLNQQVPVQRMASMTRTFPFDSAGSGGTGGTGSTAGITSLDSAGFTVGTSASVNRSGTTYHYAAWNQCAGEMKTGSYAGNGAASRAISGVGFQPAYTIVRANDSSTGRNGVQRPASVTGTGSQLFSNTANISNGIIGLAGDGLTVGNYSGTNASSISYSYVAFSDKP